MKASFVDLRQKSAEIIRALERNEAITLYYRGHPKATIRPLDAEQDQPRQKASAHAAFGLWSGRDDMKDAAAYVRNLRKGRVHGL